MSLRLQQSVKEGLKISWRSRKERVNALLGNGNDCDTAFLYDLAAELFRDSDWPK